MPNLIYNTSQGLACADWKCHREAKFQPENLVERIAAEEADEDKGELASRNVKCAIHGPAVEKRRKYGTITKYVDITDDVRKLALDRRRSIEQDRAAEAKVKASAERERQKGLTARAWEELAVEPEYVVRYKEEDRYADGNIKRSWQVFNVETLAVFEKRLAEMPEDERRYVHVPDEAEVEVVTRNDDGLIRPAYLRSRVSNNFQSGKFAVAWAEALTKASEVLDATNVRLREQHERMVKESK